MTGALIDYDQSVIGAGRQPIPPVPSTNGRRLRACPSHSRIVVAEQVIADRHVVAVIGTLCSASAVEASPLLSRAGLVMISPTNTSPALTSDLAGNASAHYHAGYFRTASNDLYQGQAVAQFAYRHLGLRRMVSIEDGDLRRLSSAHPSPYWAHAYDATTLLLSAVKSVAVQDGGTLYVDRAALREELAATAGFRGGASPGYSRATRSATAAPATSTSTCTQIRPSRTPINCRRYTTSRREATRARNSPPVVVR